MAKISINVGTNYTIKLEQMASQFEEIGSKALIAGANVIADEIRKNANSVLSGESTGDMMKSFGITPVGRDLEGRLNIKVGFDGYDRRGTPNQLKARAIESGTSFQIKKPFVRPALRRKHKECVKVINQTIVSEIAKIMK